MIGDAVSFVEWASAAFARVLIDVMSVAVGPEPVSRLMRTVAGICRYEKTAAQGRCDFSGEEMCFHHTPPSRTPQLYDRVAHGIQVVEIARAA